MLIYRALYVTCVALLGGSPVLSLALASAVGGELNYWRFIWVGPVMSLPLSLAIAKALGPDTYAGYWTYLQSFPYNSKRTIIASWAAVSGLTLAIGLVLF